jgi:uncharacterized membrane protein YbhN (UPF0104 family)
MAGMAMTLPFGLPRYLEMQSWAIGVIAQTWKCLPRSTISATGPVKGTSPVFWTGLIASSSIGRWGLPMWNKGLSLLRQVFEALALWLKQPRSLFLALVFTWIHMICLFGVLVLLFDGMGEEISFWLVAGLYSLVYFVTLLPISINGYGLQELSMTLVFSRLGGVSVASGITGALLFRTLLMLASLPGAAFVPEMISGIKQSSS